MRYNKVWPLEATKLTLLKCINKSSIDDLKVLQEDVKIDLLLILVLQVHLFRWNMSTGSFLFLLNLVSVTARKNVLFIMVDDMWVQTEVYRHHSGFSVAPTNLHTPHLDELAETSTTFFRAYCQVALCGPRCISNFSQLRRPTNFSLIFFICPYFVAINSTMHCFLG